MPTSSAAVQNNDGTTAKQPGGVTGSGFKPGQSGNPGGRPKGLASKVRELAPPHELARYYFAIWHKDEVTLAELGIGLDEVTLRERNQAGEWLTERGYGKAPMHAAVEGTDPLEVGDVDRAIGATLDDLAARRETQAAGRSEAPPVEATG